MVYFDNIFRVIMVKGLLIQITFKLLCVVITKTYLYNIDPLKPHFYIVKLGLQGYTLFFLFLLKHRLWVLVRTASARRF